jgi:hypothetical protein
MERFGMPRNSSGQWIGSDARATTNTKGLSEMMKLEMNQPRDLGRIGAEKERSAVECAAFFIGLDSNAVPVDRQSRDRTRRTPRALTNARTRSRKEAEALFARLTKSPEVIYKRAKRIVREVT